MTGCAICAFIFGRRSAQFGLAIAIVISLAATAKAQTHSKYDDPNTAEGWSWLQIKLGLPADFGSKCGERLDPKGEDNPAYSDPKKCRTISASFIVNILTDSALRDSIGYNGVDSRNARIDGDVNLDSAKIDRALRIANSRFEGAISLGKAHAASALDLQGSLILGSLNAAEFQSESDFELDGTTIMGALDLGSAVIAGYADLRGTDCEGYFNADSFQVGKSLVMRSEDNNKASFKNVSMRGAKITGQIDMNGASFDGDLDADSLQVGGSLFMRSEDNNKASFKDVSMRGANIAGQVDMAGARFEGDLSADNLQVGQDLLMLSDENKASFNAVYLNSANVTGRLTMDGALFQRDLTADGLQVGGDVSMRDIYTDRSVEIRRAQLKGNLDLGGADLFNLNLRGTSIVGEMRLGDRNSIVDWLAPRDSHLDPRDIFDLSMLGGSLTIAIRGQGPCILLDFPSRE